MYKFSKRIRNIIGEFHKYRIGVLGDIIYDRYIWGKAGRISPEAPVPVVKVERTTGALGGAANVMRNIAALGAQASAFGVLGHDPDGDEVIKLCKDWHIDTKGIVFDPSRITTVKTRLLANNQQVARIDDERDDPIDVEVGKRVLSALTDAIFDGKIDALIIEDYNKGVVTDAMISDIGTIIAGKNIPLALDPHPANAFKIKGLTVLTPNRSEAFALVGEYYAPSVFPLEQDEKLCQVASAILEKWPSKLLLITLGNGGMALFNSGDDEPVHIPTVAKEVFDVSGAGDTVISAFVLAYLAGATAYEAAVVANHAAGIVVGKIGTVPVDVNELLASFE